MTKISRLGGLLADAALGLPLSATPYTLERDVAVPMPDGVSLLGNLYRPAHRSGPLPAVLIRLPYGRGGAGQLLGASLARRGLQVFIQSTRGTFGSGGHFRPFTTEREDGLATLRWLREQDWCDGRVAMSGASYFGHTQWAIAPYADPPLVSVSPHVTASKVTSAFYEHGVPQILNALNWSVSIGRQEAGGLPPVVNPPLKARIAQVLRRLPLQAADTAAAGAPVPFWRDFVSHAGPSDDFWAVADHDKVDMSTMPPVNMVTGWWDLFLLGQLSDYAALRKAGVQARLLVGPWLHGAPGELRAVLRSDATWLNHHLNGGPAPKGKPVKLFLQQAHRWLEFDEWPPPQAEPVKHHLRAGGRLTTDAPGAEEERGEFTYDPADPTPTVGGPLLVPPGKQADNREVEQRRDTLVYTGPVLTKHVDIVGPVSAKVFVRTGNDHFDLFVRLCDVDERGGSRNIVDGIVRIDPENAPEADDQGIRLVGVELFPTAYRVRAGHRLRVQVAGGGFPRFARNLGTGEPFGMATEIRTCRFEIVNDAAHPSHVELSAL